MLFDDDTVLLEVLDYYFSAKDFEVQTFSEPILCPLAQNSGVCLNPCADIIITDFQMPRINGVELLHYQTERRCPINVRNKAIMSGALPDDFLAKMKELADTFFQKPIHMQELNDWAKECISRNDLSQPLGRYGEATDVLLSRRQARYFPDLQN